MPCRTLKGLTIGCGPPCHVYGDPLTMRCAWLLCQGEYNLLQPMAGPRHVVQDAGRRSKQLKIPEGWKVAMQMGNTWCIGLGGGRDIPGCMGGPCMRGGPPMGRGGPWPGPGIIIAGGMGSPAMLAPGICIPAFRQKFASQTAQYRATCVAQLPRIPYGSTALCCWCIAAHRGCARDS